jgi:hypothetical protein
MLPRGMMELGPTPKNGREGVSLDMEIRNFWKAARLMRLRAAPPLISMWYSLTLVMVGEMTSRSCPAPAMFLWQSEASKPMDISIHLWWGIAAGASAAAVHDMELLAALVGAGVRVGVVIDGLEHPFGVLE